MKKGQAEEMALKNRNVNRLLKEMKRLSVDINDNEICRKFEILIKSGNEVDITAPLTTSILDDPSVVDEKEVPDIYLMYFRHYRFQRKREKKSNPVEVKESGVSSNYEEESPRSSQKNPDLSARRRRRRVSTDDDL